MQDLLNQAFDLYQVRRQTNAENKLNAEPQSEAQKQETVFIKQLNSEGKTTDIKNPTNNTDEQKKVLVVQDRVKLENTDDGKLIQGEAKVIEVTEIQLLKTATESMFPKSTNILFFFSSFHFDHGKPELYASKYKCSLLLDKMNNDRCP